MPRSHTLAHRDRLASEFSVKEQNRNAQALVESLCAGMGTLSDLLYTRIHRDVEANFGLDSMMAPISIVKSEQQSRLEFDLYQVAESATYVQLESWVGDVDWYAEWLGRLLLPEEFSHSRPRVRVRSYLARDDDERRQLFVRQLQKLFPEASRAPLVLYRLLPYAVRVVTAIAFGRITEALELRHRQSSLLTSILDCHRCHARPLDNGEQCTQCGNPLWTYQWLTAID